MPLFFWLLDTSIINSFLICKELKLCDDHKNFRLQLVNNLIKDATSDPLKRKTWSSEDQSLIEEKTNVKKYRVTNSFELPVDRFVGNEHFPEHKEKRDAYLWCRYKSRDNEKASKNPPQSQLWCSGCGIALCCNKQRSCFKKFHTISE